MTVFITPIRASFLTTAPIGGRVSKSGPTQLCAVFGPTCDALDTISLAEQLPDLKMGDYLYGNTIGA